MEVPSPRSTHTNSYFWSSIRNSKNSNNDGNKNYLESDDREKIDEKPSFINKPTTTLIEVSLDDQEEYLTTNKELFVEENSQDCLPDTSLKFITDCTQLRLDEKTDEDTYEETDCYLSWLIVFRLRNKKLAEILQHNLQNSRNYSQAQNFLEQPKSSVRKHIAFL